MVGHRRWFTIKRAIVMNPDALAQLKDIQTPEQIGQWPLAWGWWALMALVTLLLIALTIWLVKRHKHRFAKRQALTLLKASAGLEARAKVASINNVLKRVNLAYQERDVVAELSGKQWANWLNQHNEKAQIDAELLQLSYRPQCNEEDAHLYYLQVQQWLKKALPLKPVARLGDAEVSHV